MNPNAQPTTPHNGIHQPGKGTVDDQILQKKISEFSDKLQRLQEEYGLVLVPILNSTQFGLFPDLKVFTVQRYAELMGKVMGANGIAAVAKKE